MAKHIAALDGLRAVSIVFVIYSHLSFANAIPKAIRATSLGLDGVLIFFVISGYLITSQLVIERNSTGTIRLGYFWRRRALRLLPASFLMIFVTWLIGYLGYLRVDRTLLLHALSYTMDYYRSPFANALEHLWSLSVEEQFYLLWPFAVLLAACRGSRALCGCVILACPCIRLWGWYLGGIEHDLVFRRFDMVADSLAMGCLLSMIEEKLPKWLISNTCVLTSFIVILATGVAAARLPALAFAEITVDSLCAAMIIRSLKSRQLWVSRCLSWPPLAWLGTISYSLYLWQELFAFPRHTGALKIFMFPYNLCGMLFCAVLSYYLVENPIRAWGKRFGPSRQKACIRIEAAA